MKLMLFSSDFDPFQFHPHHFLHLPAPTSLKERYSSALGASRGPLIDLLKHILGRLPPGVSQIPQAPKTRSDRINQHYEELSAVLVFLK